MKILVRKELDYSQPVNLRRLKPMKKIWAGIVTKWRETNYYKTSLHKQLEADHAARVLRDEKLKDALMATIYNELNNNATLKKRKDGGECDEVVIQVQSKFINSLDRVLGHKDFLPYNVEKIKENQDIRLAFPEMPIRIRVSKKHLEEVNQ